MESIHCFLKFLAYFYKITTDHFSPNHSKYVITLEMNINIFYYHRKCFHSHHGTPKRKLIFFHGVCHIKGKGHISMVVFCG